MTHVLCLMIIDDEYISSRRACNTISNLFRPSSLYHHREIVYVPYRQEQFENPKNPNKSIKTLKNPITTLTPAGDPMTANASILSCQT